MKIHGPQLPSELFAGGSSVAIIAKPIEPGVLAHRSHSETREVDRGHRVLQKETFYIAACAADEPQEADEAYLVSIHWAHSQAAAACTEAECFPQAVARA